VYKIIIVMSSWLNYDLVINLVTKLEAMMAIQIISFQA